MRNCFITILFFVFLLLNGQEIPVDFQQAKPFKTNGSATLDLSSGQPAFHLVNTTAQSSSVCFELKLPKRTPLQMSFYCRGDKIKRGTAEGLAGGGVNIVNDGKILFKGNYTGRWTFASGSFDWQKCEVELTTGESDLTYLYLLLENATGDVWFQDVKFTPMLPQKAEPLIAVTSLFPVDYQKGRYHLAGNFPGTISFTFQGRKEKLRQPKLIIDLPAGYDCLGGSAIWPASLEPDNWQWQDDLPQKTQVQRNNFTYNRYQIILSPAMIARLGAWNNNYRVFLVAPGGQIQAPQSVFLRLQDGDWQGAEQVFTIETIQAVTPPTRKTQQFKLMICNIPNLYCGNPEVKTRHVEYWRSLADKPWAKVWHWNWCNLGPQRRQEFLGNFIAGVGMATQGSTPYLNFSKWWKQSTRAQQYPWPDLVWPRAKRAPEETLCPQYLINDPHQLIWDDYYVWGLKNWKGDLQVKFIDLDLEPGATSYCFCQTCRERFSKQLSSPNTLTENEIKQKYPKQWFDFRLQQHAELVKVWSAASRRHFPESLVALCTDPLRLGNSPVSTWCGVDSRLSDGGELDLFMNMPYFQGRDFFDTIEMNNRLLKTANFPFIDPTEEMERYYVRYTPDGVKQNMLAAAALGCVGLAFYPTDFFDGRYLVRIAEGAEAIACGEKYYACKRMDGGVSVSVKNVFVRTFVDDGESIELAWPNIQDSLRHTLHELDKNFLFTLFNYDLEHEAIVNLTIPAASELKIRELPSGRIYTQADPVQGFLAAVPASSVLLLEFLPDPPAGSGSISQDMIEQKLADCLSLSSQMERFPTYQGTASKISWGVLRPEKKPLLKMTLHDYSVYISPDQHANVAGWQKNGFPDSDLLRFKEARGFLGDLLVLSDHSSRKLKYDLVRMEEREGNPTVQLRYLVPQPNDANPEPDPFAGLEIIKHITLLDQGRTLRFDFFLTNNSPLEGRMILPIRVRNLPLPGHNLAGQKDPVAMISIQSGTGKVASGSPMDNLFLRAAADGRQNAMPGVAPSGVWQGDPVVCQARDGSRTEILTFLLDDSFSGWYSWSDNVKVMTLEGVAEPVTLAQNETFRISMTVKR